MAVAIATEGAVIVREYEETHTNHITYRRSCDAPLPRSGHPSTRVIPQVEQGQRSADSRFFFSLEGAS